MILTNIHLTTHKIDKTDNKGNNNRQLYLFWNNNNIVHSNNQGPWESFKSQHETIYTIMENTINVLYYLGIVKIDGLWIYYKHYETTPTKCIYTLNFLL